MGIIDKLKNVATSAVGGGWPYDIVCAYACPQEDYKPNIPWTSSPDMIINPEPPKEEIMNIEYYKKKFAELFMEMEREHGYGGHVRQADGSLLFDWFPVIYELVTERPCTINIAAGYNGKLHRFTVRGQARPAATTTNAPTH